MQQVLIHSRAQLDAEARAGLQRQLTARKMHDCWERLPELRLPVLVCGGEDDGICPPQNLRNLAAQIPGATLQFFHGGHGFYLEDPRALPVVREFLTGV